MWKSRRECAPSAASTDCLTTPAASGANTAACSRASWAALCRRVVSPDHGCRRPWTLPSRVRLLVILHEVRDLVGVGADFPFSSFPRVVAGGGGPLSPPAGGGR